MPHLVRPDGVKIHWEERGSGPLVVLAPYANANPTVYDPLEEELVRDHRLVRYDDRGTGASDHAGPFDMETAADDMEAVLEEVGGSAVLVALGDAVHRGVRVAARRPELVHAVVVPGGSPAGRNELEGTDAMVTSDSVLDAFLGMAATDYRGALRSIVTAANPQMSEEEVRERVTRQVAYQPQETALARWNAWADDDATEPGRACGERLWLLYSDDMSGGWFPAGEEGRRLARRLFPEAHVEKLEEGMISRPDLTGGFVRRITASARAAAT